VKLQIKYNFTNTSKALAIARQTAQFADIIEVGSLLIFKEGAKAVEAFKEEFPEKEIYADAKIACRGEESAQIFAAAGATYISVLAGTYDDVIQSTCTSAANSNCRIVLDCLNASSLGKSAAQSKTMGVHSLLFHRNIFAKEGEDATDNFQEIRDNTDLPIFVKGRISAEILKTILPLKPAGIVIGSAITRGSNPVEEAEKIKKLIS
jgi:3-keto-L-gulonate-6-phosphate decarboxylase